MPHLLVAGCGYVGSEVARLAQGNYEVSALTRSPDRVQELSDRGIQPWVGHWLDSNSLRELPKPDALLVAVPHRADGELGKSTHCVGLENLLAILAHPQLRVVYLSTTGVYGKDYAEWVDEDTPVSPTRIGPEIAVEAENWLGSNASHAPWQHVILRLAGIYGPGRIPLAEKIRSGEALAVPQQGYLNLVHVHDIARMILTLLEGPPSPHSCYLFSDGHPTPRMEFYRYMAHLLGVDQPSFLETDEATSKARRATSKRINPKRILADTNFEFRFPDYRSGLRQALALE